jgi:hypothetical protein
MITFNTGRKYTAEGQRIAAAQVDGKTYFVDADRYISGVFTKPVVLTERAVLAAYDAGDYTMSFHPIMRELSVAG